MLVGNQLGVLREQGKMTLGDMSPPAQSPKSGEVSSVR
jgi:hypothetical protein